MLSKGIKTFTPNGKLFVVVLVWPVICLAGLSNHVIAPLSLLSLVAPSRCCLVRCDSGRWQRAQIRCGGLGHWFPGLPPSLSSVSFLSPLSSLSVCSHTQHMGTFMRWLDPSITQRLEQHVRSWKNEVHESYLGGSGRPSRVHPQLFFVGFNVRFLCFVFVCGWLCLWFVFVFVSDCVCLCAGLDWFAARVRS